MGSREDQREEYFVHLVESLRDLAGIDSMVVSSATAVHSGSEGMMSAARLRECRTCTRTVGDTG